MRYLSQAYGNVNFLLNFITEKWKRSDEWYSNPSFEESLGWTVFERAIEISELNFLQYPASVWPNESCIIMSEK